jgi:hypothetical protein
MGTISAADVGRYGFVPDLRTGSAVTVDVFDLNRTPAERIAQIDVAVGGDSVQTGTTPQFGVRALRVVSP